MADEKYRLYMVSMQPNYDSYYGIYSVLEEDELGHLDKPILMGTKEELLIILDGIKKAIEDVDAP